MGLIGILEDKHKETKTVLEALFERPLEKVIQQKDYLLQSARYG